MIDKKDKLNPGLLDQIWFYIQKYINLKMGVFSGIVTGSIVFVINIEFGFWPAFASFWKQFLFNVIMAGYNTRSCERLAKSISNNGLALLSSSVIPTLQAFLILYTIHYVGRTPKPLASTLWQAIANLVFFFSLALVYRGIFVIESKSVYKMARLLRLRLRLGAKKIIS